MGEFVLMKRGLYWRPDACGYTGVLAEAGRYTKEQAEARVDASSKPSVTAHRVEDCAEFSPACWPETQIAVLRAENERLREALEFYADPMVWRTNAACDPNASWFTGPNTALAALGRKP